MIELPGYELTGSVFEGEGESLFRAVREPDGLPVLVRFSQPDPEAYYRTAIRLRRYYEAGARLKLERTLRPLGYESSRAEIALIIEDFGGIPLPDYRKKSAPGLSGTLEVVTGAARALAELHSRGHLHLELAAPAVFVRPEDGKVKLAHVGRACQSDRSPASVCKPTNLPADWTTRAPEELGCVADPVGYYSDLYSFGLLAFELITGQAPFRQKEPVELLAAMLKGAPAARTILPEVPAALETLLARLLAPHPADRYWNAGDLALDLQQCLQQIKDSGLVGQLVLQSATTPAPVELKSLAGRADLVQALREVIVDCATGSVRTVLVRAGAGQGALAVAHAIVPDVIRQRGLFLRSACNESAGPAGPFLDFLRQAFYSIQSCGNDERLVWKRRVSQLLGSHASVAVDLVPELESLLGPQSLQTALPPRERANRFVEVVRLLFRALAEGRRPIVLVFEDISRLDESTRRLLDDILLEPLLSGVAVILCEEGSDGDVVLPLQDRANQNVLSIEALPVPEDVLRKYVQQRFAYSASESEELVLWLNERADGNALQLTLMLEELERATLLGRGITRHLQWRFDKVRSPDLPVGLPAHVRRAIASFDAPDREVLTCAALLGFEFDARSLALAAGFDPVALAGALARLSAAKLIHAFGDSGLLFLTDNAELLKGLLTGKSPLQFRFADRAFQSVTLEQLAREDIDAQHLEIGRMLLAGTAEPDREEHLFQLVFHFLSAREQITIPDERVEFARLCLSGARRALDLAAPGMARDYLETGIEFLPDGNWGREHNLTRGLYELACESEELLGNTERARELFRALLGELDDRVERAHACVRRGQALLANNRPDEALRVFRRGLKFVGVRPGRPSLRLALRWHGLRTRIAMRGRAIEATAEGARMKDPRLLAIMRLIHAAIPAASAVDPDWLRLLALIGVRLSLRRGQSRYSALCYGTIALSALDRQEHKSAYELGRLMIRLLDHSPDRYLKGRAQFFFASRISFFSRPYHTSHEHADLARRYASDTGNLPLLARIYHFGIRLRFVQGESLVRIREIIAQQHLAVLRTADRDGIALWRSLRHLVLELENQSDAAPEIPADLSPAARATWFLDRAFAAVLGRRHSEAIAFLEDAVVEKHARASLDEVLFRTLWVLASGDAALENPGRRNRILRQIEIHAAHLASWSASCALNFEHFYHLILAQRARLQGDADEAMVQFRDAGRAARRAGNPGLEALISERFADFLEERGFDELARVQRFQAREAYQAWGAGGRVKVIDGNESAAGGRASVGPVAVEAVPVPDDSADLGAHGQFALHQACRILADIADRGPMLDRLTEYALQHSGARRAYLVMRSAGPRGPDYFLEAEIDLDNGNRTVLQHVSIYDHPVVIPVVIEHVVQTGAPLLARDLAIEGIFVADPVVSRNRPRSVLCVPMAYRGESVGWLYLENNEAAAVFDGDLLPGLEALLSQGAVALARLNELDRIRSERQVLAEKAYRAEERSRDLASRVLPTPAVEGYLVEGQVGRARYREVAYLALQFCGLEGKAGLTEEFVGDLVRLKRSLADIAELHQALWIQTQDGAWAWAAGLDHPSRADPIRICQMALVLRRLSATLPALQVSPFEKVPIALKAAIHCGDLEWGTFEHDRSPLELWGSARGGAEWLLTQAAPGDVVVSEETRRRVQEFFESAPMGVETRRRDLVPHRLLRLNERYATDEEGLLPGAAFERRIRDLSETSYLLRR